MRLLLVADDGLVRSAYCAVFAARRLRFDVAWSPADGLTRVRRQAYDVIICEENMTAMSGTDFLRAVREFDLTVPIVLMTDGPVVETPTQAAEHGVCRYLSKSVGMDVLEETLRRLERWHAPAVPAASAGWPMSSSPR